METPSGKSGSHDRCSKAVMQDKHWLEEKKVESSSKSNMNHGLSAFGSVPLQHSADMVRSYMQACPPWASSPSLRPSGLRSPMATDHYKDKALSTIGCTSFPSAQHKRSLKDHIKAFGHGHACGFEEDNDPASEVEQDDADDNDQSSLQ